MPDCMILIQGWMANRQTMFIRGNLKVRKYQEAGGLTCFILEHLNPHQLSGGSVRLSGV